MLMTDEEFAICSILERASKKTMPLTKADMDFLVRVREQHVDQMVDLMERGSRVDRIDRIALALGRDEKPGSFNTRLLPMDMLEQIVRPTGELIPEDGDATPLAG